MLEKKVVKRKRRIKRKKGKSVLYFTAETQEAIENFQSQEDIDTRSKIYTNDIRPAFETLVENLIVVYGFAKGRHDFGTLKNDCVTFLYETLYKFDPSRGTKAFSYFNVVAKNWLILNTRKRKKVNDNSCSIHDSESLSNRDKHVIANYKTVESPDDIMILREKRDEIAKVMQIIKGKVSNPNDVACAEAINLVFEKIDDIEMLNKRAIYVYLREISGLNSKQLSTSMSTIRRIYRSIRGEVLF